MCRMTNNYNVNYSRSYTGSNGCEYLRYAQSYVPNQALTTTFSPMEGLSNGTMFPDLVRSYYPGQSMDEINYLRSNYRGGCM